MPKCAHKLSFSFLLLFLVSFSSFGQVGQIVWEDNFDTFNTDIWSADLGDGCPELCGWGNNELQYYQNENISIQEIPGEPGNFALVLEAKSESSGGKSFTSGKVTTRNNLALKYGMVEMRIKAPNDLSTGLWPAAWLLGTNEVSEGWPRSGEIDMMEMGHRTQFRNEQELSGANENNLVAANLLFYSDNACSGENPDCVASISFDKYYNQPYQGETPLTDRFLIYRLYWDEDHIRLTVEDKGIVQNFYTGPFPITSESSEFRKPFYLLLNLAVGGNFTDATTDGQVTADLPGKMMIDYVRVRQWNGKGEVYGPEKIVANAGGDKKINVGETVSLDASGSYGPITAYSWKVEGVEIATSPTHALDLSEGTHVVELTVIDSDGNTASDSFILQVGNEGIGEVLWEDQFDELDAELWNIDLGDGCDEGICGWGNQELQSYQSDNVYVEEIAEEPGNYALVLEAKSETAGSSQFTSGKVTTENKVAIHYGVIETRIKVPDLENGLWPAAWLLGVNHRTEGWPRSGEMDMMEMGHSSTARQEEGYFGSANNFVGGNLIWYSPQACNPENPNCAASIAFDKFYSTPYTPSNSLSNRFVTYRIYWNDKEIRLTVLDNGVEYDLYTNPFPIGNGQEAFRKPFYFLLNLAVGGNFTGFLDPGDITAVPAKMYIDYVRVNTWNGEGKVLFSTDELLANAGADIVEEDLDKDGVEMVVLDGTNSYGDIASYEWSENGVVLSQDATANLELQAGIHNIRLKVTDVLGNSAEDYVKVDIRELLWEENFNTYNTDVWSAETGDGCPELCGWGNQELQYYQEDNVYIEEIPGDPGNNALIIEAKSETVGGKAFTSGRVKTEGNISVKYGMVETRLKVPDDLSTGLWPAAWLLGTNLPDVGWPRSGEIDMMEMGHKNQVRIDEGHPGTTENDFVGANILFYSDAACAGNPDCAASIAFDKYYSTPYTSNNITDRFLTYRMYWDANQIRLTVVDNDVEYDFYTGPFPLGADATEFHKPFYFLLNLAVGGNFTDAASNGQVTATLPGKMMVDYIRVFRWNGVGEIASGNGIVANAGPDIIALDEDEDGKETILLDASGSSHHSGELVSYTWSLEGVEVGTGEIFEIELNRGDYDFLLTLEDNSGNTATDGVLVKVSNGGLAPVADAGPDITINDDNGDDLAVVALDGSASEESNSPIVSYSWKLEDVEIATGVSTSYEFTTGVHEVVLEVTDADGLVGTDLLIVTVIDPDNTLPVADAGGDVTWQDLDGDDLVEGMLDASASSDSDGTISSYTWIIDGVEVAIGVNPTISLSTGIYEVTLVVIDDDGESASDVFILTVEDPDNIAPNANAGEDELVIDENLDGSENYLLDASGSTDSDGTIESYDWYENGILLGSGEQLEVLLGLGPHLLELVATDDDGEQGMDQVTITINQLPVANAGEDILAIDTNSDGKEIISLDGTLSSDPDGSISVYSWMYEGSEIGTGSTIIHDFNIGTHEIVLVVTDNFGGTASDDIDVIVRRVDNAAPVADAGEDQALDDIDNSGTETFQLDASGSTDDGSILGYTWSLNGEVVATGITAQVELPVGDHTIVLEVTDDEGVTDTDEVVLTVTQVACTFEWCSSNFVAEVVTNNQITSIKFVPLNPGIGETLCLLYYGTGSGTFPGYNVTPNVPFVLNNVSPGQTVTFYYTYSAAPEESTVSCPNSFVVGQCAPVYDLEFSVLDDEGTAVVSAEVNLDGQVQTTDSQGNTTFSGLSEGVYSYAVSKADHETFSGTVNLTNSRTQSVTLNRIIVGTLEPEPELSWDIYPNPTQGDVLVQLQEIPQKARLEVYSTTGIKVKETSITNTETQVFLGKQPAGVYLFKLISTDSIEVKRVMLR